MAKKTTRLANPSVMNAQDRFRLLFGRWTQNTDGISFSVLENDNTVQLDKIFDPVPLEPDLATGNVSLTDGTESFTDAITSTSDENTSLFRPTEEIERPLGSVSDRTGNPIPFNPYPTLVPTHVQTVRLLDTRDKNTTTHQSWVDIVNNLFDPTIVYEDYVTSFDAPATKEEMLNIEGSPVSAPATIDYVYNFSDIPYERVAANVTNHVVLPNLYSMLDESTKIGTTPVTDDTDINVLRSPTARQLRRNIRNRNQRLGLQNKIVPIENMPLLADYEGSKYLFQMYVNMNIPLDKNKKFAEVMKDSTMGIALTRDVEGVPDVASQLKSEPFVFSTQVIAKRSGVEETNISEIQVKTLNLLDWTLIDAPSYVTETDTLYEAPFTFSFVGADAGSFQELGNFNSVSTAIANNDAFALALENCYDGLKDLADNNRRTFQDLIGGKEAYSEMLMYKVEKRLGPVQPVLQDPIQTFHFMNSAEVEEFLSNENQFKFVDTQVKYGTEYIYTVTGYRAVIGTRYQYGNPTTVSDSFENPNNRTASVPVFTTPMIKLVEVPLLSSTGRILDNPPLKPEVRFFPVVGDRSSIKMFFTTSTGMKDVEPIAFSQEEASEHAQIAINQNRNDGKLTFKTDDSASAFEIYRISEPPVTIDDFAEQLFATVLTSSPTSVPLNGSSATALVSQIPNQKYYYVFRTVDTHGHKSNPSAVFEIELYNDGGAGYPIIRHYDMASPDPTTTTKSARKIIQIIPRISQVYLNEAASGLLNEDGQTQPAGGNRNIQLGTEDEPLFGKKFKVRITSRSTGKKLDLNIDFKTKQLKSS
tara:strand:+ start:1694 stop:4135 length:2442 start_codon:yes stop_codon:yes gene_type:complete